MKGKASGRFLANAGQFGKLLNQTRQGWRVGRHRASSLRSAFQMADLILQAVI
jgi:hypothetical protein